MMHLGHVQGIHATTAYCWCREGMLPVLARKARPAVGMTGTRTRARRLLTNPAATVVLVEHCDRLGRITTALAKAALSAHGCRLVVLDDSEVIDDLGRDTTGMLVPFCARRSARNRALTAAGRARRDVGRQADLEAGTVRCRGGG